MKQSIRLFILLALFSMLSACHKDDVNPNDDSDLTINQRMNKFIDARMKDIYLWADKIKGVEVDLNKEPEDFLKAIRYNEDLWSSLELSDTETRSSVDGKEKTFGYKIQFYKITNGLVGGMIQYIYKGSPAAKAGLMRGDMIFANNGKLLTETSFTQILTDEQVVLKTGIIFNDTLFVSKQDFTLSQVTLQQDPILLDTVFEAGNKKIGYLVYSKFYDDQASSLSHLSQAIGRIKAASVDEFILDLRYNTGGAETAARRLGSLLAPANNVRNQDILIHKQWNPAYQQKFSNKQLVTRFDSDVLAENLDLQRIYILTGENTASASEVVISGLRPYIPEVILIGSRTYGKYVGMSEIIPPADLQKWILWPVTFTYTNAAGESVKGGLAPTFTSEEYHNYLPPFGDQEDPLLGKALELIGGEILPASAHLVRSSHKHPVVSWKPLRNTEKYMLIAP